MHWYRVVEELELTKQTVREDEGASTNPKEVEAEDMQMESSYIRYVFLHLLWILNYNECESKKKE